MADNQPFGLGSRIVLDRQNNQNLNNTGPTTLIYNQDVGGGNATDLGYNLTTGIWTVPDGLWIVMACAEIGEVSANGIVELRFIINGSFPAYSTRFVSRSNGLTRAIMTTSMPALGGTTINVQRNSVVNTENISFRDTGAGNSRLSMVKIANQ